MSNDPTDYLTVSGHITGPAVAAFKRATPERGDASKYVRRAVEKLLESEGFMDAHRENEDIHAAIDALLETGDLTPEQILAHLSSVSRQSAAAELPVG